MATEKLSEGIRLFVADAVKLDALIEAQRGSTAGNKGRAASPAFFILSRAAAACSRARHQR